MLVMNAPPSTIRRSSTSQTSQLHRTSTRNRAVSIDTPTFSANYAGYSQPQNNYAFSGPECSSLAYYHQDSMSAPYGYGGSSSGHKGVYSNTDEETLVESVTSFDTIHPTLGLHPEHGVETSFHSNGRVSMAFGHRFDKPLPDIYRVPVEEVGIDETGFARAPPMNVNIMIVGSRGAPDIYNDDHKPPTHPNVGDVQPYLALGQRLQKYGHTVRLATHETFRKLVKEAGLRFFNIGGDPHELMSYMVRNPGLIPGFKSITNGDIGKKQKMVAEV
ncbi:Glycosyltransferase family 1 protein, partial [Rhizoctonia solani]